MPLGTFITRRVRLVHNLCRPGIPCQPATHYSTIRRHGSNSGQNGRSGQDR